MDKSKIDEIKKASANGKISCKAALGLAEKLGVSPAEVGKVLDDEKIKIKSCQLGCFK